MFVRIDSRPESRPHPTVRVIPEREYHEDFPERVSVLGDEVCLEIDFPFDDTLVLQGTKAELAMFLLQATKAIMIPEEG